MTQILQGWFGRSSSSRTTKLKELGGNDLDNGHSGSRKKQRIGILNYWIPIDRAAHDAIFNWWIDGEYGNHIIVYDLQYAVRKAKKFNAANRLLIGGFLETFEFKGTCKLNV